MRIAFLWAILLIGTIALLAMVAIEWYRGNPAVPDRTNHRLKMVAYSIPAVAAILIWMLWLFTSST